MQHLVAVIGGAFTAQFPFPLRCHHDGYASGWPLEYFTVPLRTVMRAVVHILHERHTPAAVHWHHVKAHNDHPWNEFVDRLAKHDSLAGHGVPNCKPWIAWMHDESTMTALQWVWYWEHLQKHPADGPRLVASILTHSFQGPQVPPPLRSAGLPAHDYQKAQFTMRIATVNVLSLCQRDHGQQPALTRQRILQQQLHDAGCHVVALQETRHKHVVDKANELYHIIAHPVLPQFLTIEPHFARKG